ncbi:hypothetical protein O181_043887 [Austropuccinia psidii MF-1]|uniref:Zn(2)-C6 fungal-type domain-containing protein n=1 Tax=Austropuccinia psidii MF-1 TaxID=1389203 RepID=A0A9Q3DLF6_9BASI|nr:hypothetical protein [Austropuccinia psidii MF-1]
MLCTLCTKGGIPCIHSSTTTDPCDACRQAHKKCLFIVCPFQPRRQRSSRPGHPRKYSFVVDDYETISKHKWTPGPQTGQREQFWTISPVPSSIDFSTPLLGHHLMVTSLLDWREAIIRPMKDGDGKRTFELGLIVTMSCHRWDLNAKVKQNPANPPQQDSPVPSLPCKQTPRQPTPGPSGTQWSEELFREPSQTKEPPIPAPSPSSEPPEDIPTCEPEPEVALTQSTEEAFARPATPRSIIIIDDMPIGPPLPLPLLFPPSTPTPVPSQCPHEPQGLHPQCQAPLIPTMTLARNLPTYDQL